MDLKRIRRKLIERSYLRRRRRAEKRLRELLSETRIYYLCDGNIEECLKSNCYRNKDRKFQEACMHTKDIRHAINFDHGLCDQKSNYYEMIIDGRRVPACDRREEIAKRLRDTVELY